MLVTRGDGPVMASLASYHEGYRATIIARQVGTAAEWSAA
jgi:hypothetical protein